MSDVATAQENLLVIYNQDAATRATSPDEAEQADLTRRAVTEVAQFIVMASEAGFKVRGIPYHGDMPADDATDYLNGIIRRYPGAAPTGEVTTETVAYHTYTIVKPDNSADTKGQPVTRLISFGETAPGSFLNQVIQAANDKNIPVRDLKPSQSKKYLDKLVEGEQS
jgi:hypothetical protein